MDPRRSRFCEAGHTVALKLHGQARSRLWPASLAWARRSLNAVSLGAGCPLVHARGPRPDSHGDRRREHHFRCDRAASTASASSPHLRSCLSALCTFEVERGPNSTACEQSESSLAALLGELRLYFFPAVEFAGVRERNCPSVYFEPPPAHRVSFPICCPAAAVGETLSMRHAAARRKNPDDVQNLWGNSTATLSASLIARTRALADRHVREVAAAGQKNPGLRSRP